MCITRAIKATADKHCKEETTNITTNKQTLKETSYRNKQNYR
jgi:hypothetical protein